MAPVRSRIDHIPLTGPTIGTLTTSWRQGLQGADGLDVEWQCGPIGYPCPLWPSASMPTGCGGPSTCWPDPGTDACDGVFSPIRISTTSTCDCLATAIRTDRETMAREMLESVWRADLARYMWDGSTSIGGTIAPTAQTTFAGARHLTTGPYSLAQGIGAAVGAVRRAGYRGPVFAHVPDAALPLLFANGATVVGNTIRWGNITVVADPGYPGSRPDDPTSGGYGTGSMWIVVTGPGQWDATATRTELLNPTGAGCAKHGYRATIDAAARVMCSPMVAVECKELC